jgi:hypothetical protein
MFKQDRTSLNTFFLSVKKKVHVSIKNKNISQAQACNHSYSSSRDQENLSLKPDQANSSARPYLKKHSSQKRAGRVAQSIGPEFKSQYQKINK